MTLFRCFASCVVIVAATAAASAEENPLAIRLMSYSGKSSPLAVELFLRAQIGKPVTGHEYVFRHQLRLHAKKGEFGPLLGLAAVPTGTVFDLGPLVKPKGAGWMYDTPSAPAVSKEAIEAASKTLEFDGVVDVTRKELSGMTNLPKDTSNVIIRVEPQIYDATDRKYVTVPKTNAVLLFLETGSAGQVWSVQTFQEWFPSQFDTVEHAKAAVSLLDEFDAWDRHRPLIAGFERVLANKGTKPEILTVAVRAVPAELIYSKNDLPALLTALTSFADAGLKAAAQAKLAESMKR